MLTIFAVLFDARQRGVEDGAAPPTVNWGYHFSEWGCSILMSVLIFMVLVCP